MLDIENLTKQKLDISLNELDNVKTMGNIEVS